MCLFVAPPPRLPIYDCARALPLALSSPLLPLSLTPCCHARTLLSRHLGLDNLTVMDQLVWGQSAKHTPQRCGKDHVLADEDVIQIVKKVG